MAKGFFYSHSVLGSSPTLKYRNGLNFRPNFHPLHTTMSCFWVAAQIPEKCTKWPQMPLTCSRSKIPTCMLHTPTRAKFSICFTLQWAIFELRPNFWREQPFVIIWKSYLSTPGGRNWANFCSMGTSFQDMGHFSKLPYLGMKIGNWPKLHIYPLSIPGGWNWPYFRSTGSGFRYTGQFSKLPYMGMKLGNGESAKTCTYTLSTPGGKNLAYFHSTGSGFQNKSRFSKLPYLGMKLDHWPKYQKLHIYSLATLGGRNWAYFRSTSSGFRDTGRFSKLAIFGHETWPLATVAHTHQCTLFLPQGVEIELIFALWAAVSELRAVFQNWPYLGMKFGDWQKLHMHTNVLSSYPKGSKLSLFSLFGQQFPRYGPIFKIAIFGHETWPLAKVPEVAHILSFLPMGSKLNLFSLYGQRFPRYGPIFKIGHIWAWNLAIGQSARSCKYTLFLLQGGRNGAYFHSTGRCFQDTGRFS